MTPAGRVALVTGAPWRSARRAPPCSSPPSTARGWGAPAGARPPTFGVISRPLSRRVV